MNEKSIALITHIPIIGWFIAWIANFNEKDEYASFYNRQMLGINILWISGLLVPLIGWIFSLGICVFWIISLIGVFNGERKLIPYLGTYFQDWFKSI